MKATRFEAITSRYAALRVAVLGDFCLDRYLEIDPARAEVSIETGLPVHNVVMVRSQPGAAGTILNNLVALGIGQIVPVGFCGEDGEGFELVRALKANHGVSLEHFLQTPLRRTFTYCKPLVVVPGAPPRELNRLDSKNWSPTPPEVSQTIVESLRQVASRVDAVILMDQVDVAETGVVTSVVLESVAQIVREQPNLLIMADSRRSLRGYPSVCLKMNASELDAMVRPASEPKADLSHAELPAIRSKAGELAAQHGKGVFITLAERGVLAALPDGTAEHCPALPVRGDIDVVGAGDAVTANLTAALASGASLSEALSVAMAAASIVVHQLGTTGTASVPKLRAALGVS